MCTPPRPARARVAALLAAALAACAGPRGEQAPRAPGLPTGRPLRLEAETLGGGPVVLGGAGPVRLVELWATWCAPCRPAAERARAVLAHHPDVAAYAVSVDRDREALARAVAARPPPGVALALPGGTSAALRQGISQLPTFLVLDRDGRVTGAVEGDSDALATRLDELLQRAEGRSAGRGGP